MGIRFERRQCEETHLNLAHRSFCRLGLGGRVPNHPTLSKNKHGRFFLRERCVASAVREHGATLPLRGPGQPRRACGRRQLINGATSATVIGRNGRPATYGMTEVDGDFWERWLSSPK